MIRGACLCGAVRFELAKLVGPFELCHCTRCRKSTGSAFAPMVGALAADYRLVSGEGEIVRYDAPILYGPPAYRRSFCRRCGSPVPDPPPGAAWFEVPAGLLEGELGVAPDKHIYVEHQPAWDSSLDVLPRFTAVEIGAHRGARRREDP